MYAMNFLTFTTGADQSRIMQEQMSGAAMAMPADTNKAFKVSQIRSCTLIFLNIFLFVCFIYYFEAANVHLICKDLCIWMLFLGGMGGSGVDGSSVGLRECRGGSDE